MRSLTSPKFILLDEADFFPPGQQQDARDVSERYIAKSNPWIVMVSTPNAPDGLFEKIEREPEETCLYKRIFLDYTYGLDKIYTKGEIEKAKASPSFERDKPKISGAGGKRIPYSRHKSGNARTRRTGDVGLVHKYHGRKKHGYRCGMGRHVKVCHRDYPIQKQKGGSILCRRVRETIDE